MATDNQKKYANCMHLFASDKEQAHKTHGISDEQVVAVKHTIAVSANDAHLLLFLYNVTGLIVPHTTLLLN